MDFNAPLPDIMKMLTDKSEELSGLANGLIDRAKRDGDFIASNADSPEVKELLKTIQEVDRVQGMSNEAVRKAQAAYAKK
jgi:hypothetical protein